MKLTTTRTITNNAGDKVNVTFTVDFSNASEEDMANWALSNRVISGQKVWRELSKDEIMTNVNGKTFDARNIGKSIVSKDKQIKKVAETFGVDYEIAKTIVENPELIKQFVSEHKDNQ